MISERIQRNNMFSYAQKDMLIMPYIYIRNSNWNRCKSLLLKWWMNFATPGKKNKNKKSIDSIDLGFIYHP